MELCEASAEADPGEASAEVAQLAFPAGLLLAFSLLALAAGLLSFTQNSPSPPLPTVMVGPFPRLNASRSSTISIRTRSRRDDGRNRPPRPATSTPTARARPAFGFRTARSRGGSRRARGRPPMASRTNVVRAVTLAGSRDRRTRGDRRSSVHGPARSPWAGGDKVN